MIQTVWLIVMAAYARPELLVSTERLAELLDDPDVRIVDTRTRGYEESHIPGAVWLDIDASRDENNSPTFLPDIDRFIATLEELGISNDTRVVFYDDRGGIYGTRPWVVMRAIGLDNAAILNGGWPKWTAEGRPISSAVPNVERGMIERRAQENWIATADDVAELISRAHPGSRLIDTRTEEEFAGTDLRGNPRGGAIPTATNIFWEDTLESDHQTFKSQDALETLFESYSLSKGDRVITYCQGAGRAAHELFVLYLMGYDDLRLYMGSMEDWSRQPERPLN